MPTSLRREEQARAELEALVDELRLQVASSRLNPSTMILTSRRILDLWTDMGRSSLDDEVIGFTGIESQTDHILGRRGERDGDRMRFVPDSPEEAEEIEDCGRCFMGGFKQQLAELADYLAR